MILMTLRSSVFLPKASPLPSWRFGQQRARLSERRPDVAEMSPLIPSRVSGFDIVPTRDVVALARKHKRPFAFVFNQTDPKWRAGLQGIIKQLKPIGYVVPKTIRHLTVHEKATFAGKIGSEMKDATAKTAKADFAAVWKAVKTLARAK